MLTYADVRMLTYAGRDARMEALRKFLEQQLGPKTFLDVYNIMNAVSEVQCVCVCVCLSFFFHCHAHFVCFNYSQ
jgi:hypothetical protein